MATARNLRHHAAGLVARAGVASASLAGLRCWVERSPASESTYLHVRRRHVWYGFRISCHPPAYDCCRDYEQVLIDEPAQPACVRQATRRLAAAVRTTGLVVADPREVSRAIRRFADRWLDGCRYRDRRGVRWRWSASHSGWLPENDPGCDAPPAPRHSPHWRISARVRCDIRHAQNVAAAWAEEETRRHARRG